MRRMFLWLLGLLVVGTGLAWFGLGAVMNQPSSSAEGARVDVAPHATLRSVLLHLNELGALAHPRLLELYLRLHGQNPKVQPGTYAISAHATPRQVIEELAAARALLESVTVVEGWTFAQMRHALDTSPAVAHSLRGLSTEELMRALGHAGQNPEGEFFPDTYRFATGTSDEKLLQLAYERMQNELAEAWQHRDPAIPVDNAQQALVLASIIEKETGRADERTKVAAVYENRLRKGMRLQADPTVIYGLGERYDGTLHKRDLLQDGPYNSYTREGLPPSPIALPGAASLQAAMHPEASDVLYFVATGLGDGAHHFSATLAEHEAALQDYLHRIGAHAP